MKSVSSRTRCLAAALFAILVTAQIATAAEFAPKKPIPKPPLIKRILKWLTNDILDAPKP